MGITSKPAIFQADVYDLLEVGKIFHGGIVITLANGLQPEFIVGNKLVVHVFDVHIIHIVLPLHEIVRVFFGSSVAFECEW